MANLSTYGDIVGVFYGLIQDSATSQRLATTDQVDIWANSSMAEMAEYSEYIDYVVDPAGIPSIANIASITKDSGDGSLMGVWRVEIEDEAIAPTTTRDLYKSSRTWQAQTGEPRWYYMDGLRTEDGITIGLWPKPSSDFDLRIFYTSAGDLLDYASPTDRVMLPLWATPILLWGILYRFYMSESRMQNDKASQFYQMMYNDGLERLKARSYSRLNIFKAYGSGRGGMTTGDLRQLMPADGFPVT